MSLILLALVLLTFFFLYNWWRERKFVERIHKRAVFITGCDSGFGNALAKSLYTKGVPVYAACLTEEGAKKLEEETGDGLKTVIVDVTNTESVRRAAAFVRDNLPDNVVFWGVVNNAGIVGSSGPPEFFTKDDYKQAMEVNFYGMVDVINAFLPLVKQSKGRIVILTSMAAAGAFPNFAPYCASKHAATGLSKTLRLEFSVWGISVSTIMPAFYQTSLLNMDAVGEKMKQKWMTLSRDLQEEYGDDYTERNARLTQKMFRTFAATDILPVIEALEHALFSVSPRAVYYPGIMAKLIQVSPHCIINKVLMRFNALPRCLCNK